MSPSDTVGHLLDADSIAVVGASSNGMKAAGRTLRYLKMYDYRGAIYPINPHRDVVQGLPCYPSLRDLPAVPELAVVVLPAAEVAAAVEECGEVGVRAAIVFASGFAEVGGEGVDLQKQLADVARRAGVRVLGPNCNGAIGVSAGQTATFMSGIDDDLTLRDDGIAFVTQSGAMGAFILHQAQSSGLGLGRFLSTGNEMDVSTPEVIEGLVEDPATSAVLAYIEGVRAPDALRAAMSRARERDVPLVVMKVGRSATGAAAAASHTGALAGEDEVFDGLLAQYGAIRATDVDHLLDLGRIFGLCNTPKGRRLSIVTLSGGAGVLMSDAAEQYGLEVSRWDDEWAARLGEVLPAFGSARNPIDVTGALISDVGLLRDTLDVVVRHPDTDVVAVMLGNMQKQEAEACAIIADAAARTEKPIVTVWVGGTGQAATRLAQSGLAAFTEPVRAVRAIAALVDRSVPATDHTAFSATPAPANVADAPTVLDEVEAKQLLSGYGITTVPEAAVDDETGAVSAAESVGYPVVVKILSTEVGHKSDLGMVAVGLTDAGAVREAGRDIRAKASKFGLTDSRLVVQSMILAETELILGMRRDPVFGPAVALGLGGVLTEVAADVQVRLPPLTVADAHSMMERLRYASVLDGPRGRTPVDRDAVARTIVGFADLVVAMGQEFESIEINPLLIDGSGAPVAVDALIEPASAVNSWALGSTGRVTTATEET